MSEHVPGDPVKVFDLHRRTRLYCWQPATFLQHLRSGRVAVRVVTDGVARRVVTDAANVKAAS